MLTQKFEQVCNLVSEVTQLPVMVCRADGEPLYWAPGTEALVAPSAANRTVIERSLADASDPKAPWVEISQPMFFGAVALLPDGNYCFIGPAAPAPPDAGDIAQLALNRQIAEAQVLAFRERVQHIPIVSVRQFLTAVSLVHYVLTDRLISPEAFLLARPNLSAALDETLTHMLFRSRENRVLHTPASFEHYVLQAVTDGNVAKLKQALRAPQSGSVGRMSSDPLQQEKYTFICFVTLVTRAAMAGGLSPEVAFSLSDVFCQAVDQSLDISAIARLSLEMCVSFTEKVAAAQGQAKLSPPIAACCEYVSAHVHEGIRLPQLTQVTRLQARSLSRRFKSEMGLSLNDYIHRERIKEAQSLLAYSEYSISEIGYYLHYGSQSYFSTVFNKFCGVTPRQFREQAKQLRRY